MCDLTHTAQPAFAPRFNHVSTMLAVIVAGAFLLRLVFGAGMSGNDDLTLGNIALALLERGPELPKMHYEARLGLTYPLAAVFWVFGHGVWQLILLPMIFSMAGIWLAFWIGRDLFDAQTGLVAAAVVAFYRMDARFAALFFPDIFHGVAMAGAFALALAARHSPRGDLLAVIAGTAWAYAYYVKVDAFFLCFVLFYAAMAGFVLWRHLAIVFCTTGVLVGVELATYGLMLGRPFYHAELDKIASNEIGAEKYQNMLAIPKAMFITVYSTGLSFYLLVFSIVAAVLRKNCAAQMLTAYVLVFFLWIYLGVDPFGPKIVGKPQLARYLEVFAVPMAVLNGWGLMLIYRRFSRPGAVVISVCAAMIAIAFMAFDGISFQAARATRDALARIQRDNFFPLHSDFQSGGIIEFLLRGTPHQNDYTDIQSYDFLTGKGAFKTIDKDRVYLLINREYTERLEARSRLPPLVPERFGMRVTPVFTIDHPLPAFDYSVMRGLAWLAQFLPIPAIRDQILHTAADNLRPATVTVYRLDR
ncbi:MAG: glycosyltransferase family 39 protein [Acetobacteraceae bacterium]|nr:glycosyltransferase family 39 protein [Acetobacteraceae bacterium]